MLISICIPTYNSGEKLERLLNSIRIQTYKNFEIIISDDSNNDGVKEIIYSKYSNLNIKYYKNEIALGTPNNWNNAVAKSNGEWVNLMHHDDWYTSENSLQQFANAAMNHQNKLLIFSAYYHYHLEDDTKVLYHTSKLEILMLKQKYLTLYKSIMGNPSTTLINSRYKPFYYDTNFKWLIDYDFFTTLFENEHSFHYIPSALVNLGMHKEQVTAYVFQNPEYEIPESIGLLKKHGIDILKNFFVYDFYWRMYRNLKIKNIEQFNSYLGTECIYPEIENIIKIQNKFSEKQLRFGVLSKLLITYNFLKNYFKSL